MSAGSGTWVIQDDGSAKIIINTACTGLSGDVQILKGRLKLNADFTTTGDLEMKSTGGSNPGITATKGNVGKFGGAP